MRGIIRELGAEGDALADMVVIDLEAGLEHLKRATPEHTDTLLVVAEPYYRSLETATRTAALGRELGIAQVGVVANKLRDDRDREWISAVFEPHGLPIMGAVPFDQTVQEADRRPAALIDVDPECPAVRAISSILESVGEGARLQGD
ncbi:hypothetical protein BH20ACT24_BH20ACT24_12590 [soil metagenome]